MAFSLEHLVNMVLEEARPYISEINWTREKVGKIMETVSQIDEFITVLEKEIEKAVSTRKTDLKIFLIYFQKRVKNVARERNTGRKF